MGVVRVPVIVCGRGQHLCGCGWFLWECMAVAILAAGSGQGFCSCC